MNMNCNAAAAAELWLCEGTSDNPRVMRITEYIFNLPQAMLR